MRDGFVRGPACGFVGGFVCGFVFFIAACMASVARASGPEAPAPFPADVVMRVESDLFKGSDKQVARTTTLFHDGVAWDFLETPVTPAAKSEPPTMKLVEIVLHDPVRERVVIIDPKRRLKTEISTVRLERLASSLAKWARDSDDRLVSWAGGPDFSEGFAQESDSLALVGPRARYAVKHAAATTPEQAESYRRFADTAILLKALMQPGGMPPFPRLAINRELARAGAIPTEVTLEIEPRGVSFGGPTRLRGLHHTHPKLLEEDFDRIARAQAAMADAEPVELSEYATTPLAPMPSLPPPGERDDS